jgi:uncharacterized membrane protein YeaQ/YmgE (transglycosylase-associated protein family)
MYWPSRVSEAIGAFHLVTSPACDSKDQVVRQTGQNYTDGRWRAGDAAYASTRGGDMNMSSESLLVVLFVGLVAGWLAGQFVQGTGFGLIGDLVVGLLGALIGSWLLPQLGIHLGTGLISAIVNATIGAVLLLLVVRLVRGGGRWQRSWWRR